MSVRRIDPRAWLCWAGSAMLIPLMGRNPFALLSVLLAVLAVREALPPDARIGWSWIVRLGVIFVAFSVVFNVLTVRTGDRVIGKIPGWVPLIDGNLTVNSVVFGLLSGLAVLVMVLIGITLAAVLDWSAVLRLLPQSLSGAGVAGSVAFSFFPQMVATYREIVDAQAMRGYELQRSARLPESGAVTAVGRYRAGGDDVGAAGITRIRGRSGSRTLAVRATGAGGRASPDSARGLSLRRGAIAFRGGLGSSWWGIAGRSRAVWAGRSRCAGRAIGRLPGSLRIRWCRRGPHPCSCRDFTGPPGRDSL